MNERERTIRDFVVANYLLEPDSIGVDTALVRPGLIDSMGIVEAVAFLEAKFGIVVDNEDMTEANFASVAAIARFVTAKLLLAEERRS